MVYQLVGRFETPRGRIYLNCTVNDEDAKEATLLGDGTIAGGAREHDLCQLAMWTIRAGYHGLRRSE
jgi:hypothetical protein